MAAPLTTTIDPEERERIIVHVLEQLSLGRSLKRIFEEDREEQKLPNVNTFNTWRTGSEELHERIARARASGLELLLEEIPEIADDQSEDPQSRRVRIYAREVVASKLAPALYGNKVDVTSGGKPLPAPSVTLVDNRIQSVLMLVQQRKELEAQAQALLD